MHMCADAPRAILIYIRECEILITYALSCQIPERQPSKQCRRFYLYCSCVLVNASENTTCQSDLFSLLIFTGYNSGQVQYFEMSEDCSVALRFVDQLEMTPYQLLLRVFPSYEVVNLEVNY
uniref:Uncharacterized protein n=1 Tax=Glossina pallidipes TaxID=7398 RepID=A0A1A9ZRH7_GLOPL